MLNRLGVSSYVYSKGKYMRRIIFLSLLGIFHIFYFIFHAHQCCNKYIRENETRGLLLGLLEEEEYLEKKDFYTQEMPINSVFTALFKGAWCLNLCDTVIRCSMKIVPNACTAEGAKVLFS